MGTEAENRLIDAKPAPEAARDWIEDTVGALCDPIIVYPAGGWENDLPKSLKDLLPLHRLAHLMKCNQGKADPYEATDIEALLYLYPATLAAPMPHHWAKIYVYLGHKVLGDRMPADVDEKSLDDYEMGELRKLKLWIQQRKLQARRKRRRAEDNVQDDKAAPAAVEARYEQMKLF